MPAAGGDILFKLNDIVDWRSMLCVPTMLCAVTGLPPDAAAALLLRFVPGIAGDPLNADYNINDWLCVIASLGFWCEVRDFSAEPYPRRPTIDEYMANSLGAELELVFCENADKSMTHVFARHEDKVIDTYSDGMMITFAPVPALYQVFRVKRVFLIWN